jgi:hypothetical protein
MSTEVTSPATGDALLDEATWSGRIFSDGWVDAPETIDTTLWTEWQWVTSQDKAPPFPF